jgi:uncharacterized tellurite resistance protein B-like protein
MDSPLKKILLQALAAMAWADGDIDQHQEKILRELFFEEKLPAELVSQWLEFPVDFPCMDELAGLLPDSSDRLDLVTQLLHMAFTDRILDSREANLMRILGSEFGVCEEVLSELLHCSDSQPG